jgi:hypothetical protein
LLKTEKRVIHMAGHTERQWEGKFFRCGMRCVYCYKPLVLVTLDSEEIATKDHLTPLSRGGRDTIDNIAPACFECNRRKGSMTEPEFRTAFSAAFKLLTGVPAANSETRLQGPVLDLLRQESEGGNFSAFKSRRRS